MNVHGTLHSVAQKKWSGHSLCTEQSSCMKMQVQKNQVLWWNKRAYKNQVRLCRRALRQCIYPVRSRLWFTIFRYDVPAVVGIVLTFVRVGIVGIETVLLTITLQLTCCV